MVNKSSLVKDINPGAADSDPRNLTNINGTLYFNADGGLWKSDGTAEGTVLVSATGISSDTTNIDGTLYFGNGDGLWKSDGTAEGTVLVKDIKDINPDADYDDSPRNLTNINGTFYFTANRNSDFNNGISTYSTELWKSDGTAEGTVLVKNINLGTDYNSNFYLTEVNNTLYFTAYDETNGTELWKSNGTAEGTVLVKDINPGTGSFLSPVDDYEYDYFNELTEVNNTLYFSADDGTNGSELWKSDGTAEGTVLVKDINSGAGSSIPNNLTDVNGTLYFSAYDSTSGMELWKSDGTADGTVLIKDINPGAGSSSPRNLTNINGTLYFTAYNPTVGMELWKSDGTAEGTIVVKDINPGAGSSEIETLTNLNDTLYFTTYDEDYEYEGKLWKSDGTSEGTFAFEEVEDVEELEDDLIEINGTLYFPDEDEGNGEELRSIVVSEITPLNPTTPTTPDDTDEPTTPSNPTTPPNDSELMVEKTEFEQNPIQYMKNIQDYDGNDLGASDSWEKIGEVDIQGDGNPEYIFINPAIGRWATVGTDDITGMIDFDNHGEGGDTRVVGVYEDPLVKAGIVKKGSDFDSQQRFQNDLLNNNLELLAAGDYDDDGLQETYFKLGDGTAVLHAYMHADGNIQYANYQSKADLEEFMTANGVASSVWGDWL